MTACAFHGARFEILVASDTLGVKRIATFGHLFDVKLVLVMTFQAGFLGLLHLLGLGVAVSAGPVGRFIVHGVMMAIRTGDAVAADGVMGFVVEKNLSGSDLEHISDGRIRRFG